MILLSSGALILEQFQGATALYCKYDFVHGIDWTVVEVSNILTKCC